MEVQEELLRHFTRIRASILGYLRVLVRNSHMAEDLYQDTCVTVMQNFQNFDQSRDFEAWVRGIARNLARNALRKSKRLRLMPSPELAEAIEQTHANASTDETREMAAQLEHLNKCMEQIHKPQKKLLEQRYQLGASLNAIAQKTGRSVGAVQVALSRLRRSLLDCIRKQKGWDTRAN